MSGERADTCTCAGGVGTDAGSRRRVRVRGYPLVLFPFPLSFRKGRKADREEA